MPIRKSDLPTRLQVSPTAGAGAADAPASNGLGARLREARERSGATVRGLARAVGVSPSLISQIELGRVMPSVGTLYAITTEMGLLVDDMFKDSAAVASVGTADVAQAPVDRAGRGTRSAKSGPVQRHASRRAIRLATGVRWEMLTAAPDDELDFLYVVYDVGGESCPVDSMVRHGGKEFAYVLSGRLGLKLGFEEYELGPGDSMSFDAQLPHRLWTVGAQPAVAIWAVLNRQGDRRRMDTAPRAPRPARKPT